MVIGSKQALSLLFLIGLSACAKKNFSSNSNESVSSPGTDSSLSAPIDQKRDQARLDCEYFKLGLGFLASPLANGAEVRNVIGSGIFRASHVALISSVTGSVILLGTSADARVDEIKEIEGSVLICDMDALKVSAIKGSLIVVDGSIGTVDLVTGSVLAVNGAVLGPVTNSVGSVLAY